MHAGHMQVTCLTIHLLECVHEVVRVLEADEAIPLRLLAVLVPHNLGLEEGGVLPEGPGQDLVIHVIGKVTTEDPVVI